MSTGGIVPCPWCALDVPRPGSPVWSSSELSQLLQGPTARGSHRAPVPLALPLPAPSQPFSLTFDLYSFHAGAIWFAEFWKCLQLKC